MSIRFEFRRSRSRATALAVFALAAPFVLPLAAGETIGPVAVAHAEEQQKIDTSRLVSIGGAVTEIVYALGEEGRLVARDSTSTFPEAAAALPDVGYMRALSPEGVIATNPTAILAVEGSGPPDALQVLKSAGIPFETVPEGYDRDAIVRKIETVGNFLGVSDKAKALADKVAAEIDAATADSAKREDKDRKRVLFVLSFQNGKVMAAGAHTAADGILKLSGVVNATEGAFQGYKPLSDEAIVEAKPDVIMLMTREGMHGGTDEELFAHPAFALTPAAKTKSVIRMNSLHLLGFGPRTATAIRDLNAAVYGKSGNVSQ
ncbi:ABC transporter substrate-binding protein [Sinorhizobium sp. BG8]|uniref:heme/hemin ABC transporter substrate-binding protein n=1 Tax=Sinorhizobium sp. BG8 TaxID=2613773 RepID=UPI00193E68CB|nr:ABC transporter substrate-binding protein [Sinorhizobium sp. BG8]QRM57007.1 ABC transporter substrate-binding protein [Sinorhizobium sp. BG8]